MPKSKTAKAKTSNINMSEDKNKSLAVEKKLSNGAKDSSVLKQKRNKEKKQKENKPKTIQSIEKAPKGIKRQEEWIKHFRNYLKSVKATDSGVHAVIEKLLKFDCIPRKEAKFKKYLTGSIKDCDAKKVEKIWEIVKGAFEKENSGEDNEKKQTNGTSNTKETVKIDKASKKNKKRPHEVSDEGAADDQNVKVQSSPAKKKKVNAVVTDQDKNTNTERKNINSKKNRNKKKSTSKASKN